MFWIIVMHYLRYDIITLYSILAKQNSTWGAVCVSLSQIDSSDCCPAGSLVNATPWLLLSTDGAINTAEGRRRNPAAASTRTKTVRHTYSDTQAEQQDFKEITVICIVLVSEWQPSRHLGPLTPQKDGGATQPLNNLLGKIQPDRRAY